MWRVVRLGCLLALLAACGAEVVADAELGEVCGAASPFRVLELAEDEVLQHRALHVGDRWLYLVGKQGPVEPDPAVPTIVATTVWATGPCGESPVEVATEIQSIFMVGAWPDVVLGRDEVNGDIVVLDPGGVAAPHVLFADVLSVAGGLAWTPHGLLTVVADDEDFGALVLHPYPEDPPSESAVPQVVLDRIRMRPPGDGVAGLRAVLRTLDDFVLAVTEDEVLVRVELVDGAMSILQHGVAAIETSRDGRYILWQLNFVTPGEPMYPEGKIYLRDQTTGSDILLVETALTYSFGPPLGWIDEGVIQLGLGYINREPMRIFFVPGFEFVDVRADLLLTARLDGDVWLAGALAHGYYDRHDLRTGATQRLFPYEGQSMRVDGEAVELLEVPRCCITGDFFDEGPVWRVPLDGAAPYKLARRATRMHRRLDDGRIVTSVGINDQGLSELLLVDPATLVEARIDQHMYVYSLDTSRVADEGVIGYAVTDGERSGVYLARLPPADRHATVTTRPAVELPVTDLVPGRDGPVPWTHLVGERPPRER